MSVLVKFPVMDIMDEDEYQGDESEVVVADGELQYLLNRYFELNRSIYHMETFFVNRLLPSPVRTKRLKVMRDELEVVIHKLEKKVYGNTGA